MEVEGFEPPQEEVIPISAMLDPESNKWLDAMNAEMQSMIDNNVWVLVDLPPNCKTIRIRCTRPDVTFVQNITSRFQQNPGEPHWTAVKNILKGVVDWKSSKQSTTTMSATEVEYIAASEAAMKAVWIRKFILGLGIVPTINKPIKMFCENSVALLITNDPGAQKGARHYHRRYHYVRECIELGEINLLKVHTDDNLADPFTKALAKGKLIQHARSI
ncbi:hypothetical protein Tco_0008744 [Tanacetum coccineum]